jgi:hypothetical protein
MLNLPPAAFNLSRPAAVTPARNPPFAPALDIQRLSHGLAGPGGLTNPPGPCLFLGRCLQIRRPVVPRTDLGPSCPVQQPARVSTADLRAGARPAVVDPLPLPVGPSSLSSRHNTFPKSFDRFQRAWLPSAAKPLPPWSYPIAVMPAPGIGKDFRKSRRGAKRSPQCGPRTIKKQQNEPNLIFETPVSVLLTTKGIRGRVEENNRRKSYDLDSGTATNPIGSSMEHLLVRPPPSQRGRRAGREIGRSGKPPPHGPYSPGSVVDYRQCFTAERARRAEFGGCCPRSPPISHSVGVTV